MEKCRARGMRKFWQDVGGNGYKKSMGGGKNALRATNMRRVKRSRFKNVERVNTRRKEVRRGRDASCGEGIGRKSKAQE